MTLNKHACDIVHISPTALLLWSTYRPNITVHTSPKQTTPEIIAKYAAETNMPLLI